MTKDFVNPWYNAKNQLSVTYFEVNYTPIASDGAYDFYDYRGTVLAVSRCSAKVVTQCVTVEGAKRYLTSCLFKV